MGYKSIRELESEHHKLGERLGTLHNRITQLEAIHEPDEQQTSELEALQEAFTITSEQRKAVMSQIVDQKEINETSSISDPSTIARDPQHDRMYGVGSHQSTPTGWIDLKTRTPIAVLEKDQPFSSSGSGYDPKFSIGRAIQGMITNDWSNLRYEATALSKDPSSGGVVVPTILFSEIIDRARAMAQVLRAGARVVSMPHGNLTIAKLTEDPVFQVKPENEEFDFSTVEFEGVPLTAFTIGTIVRMSRELAHDSPNASQAIENALARALAIHVDRLALLGTGVDEPRGIANTDDIIVEEVGALEDYSPFSLAYQRLLENNATPNALIMHPRDWGTIDRFVDDHGQPLQPPASYQALQRLTTTSLPTDGDPAEGGSQAIMGAFENLFWGLTETASIEVTRTTTDAFKRHQIWVKIVWRGDFAVTRPDHFVLLDEIAVPSE